MEDSAGVRVPKPSLLSQLILGDEKRELGQLPPPPAVVHGNLKLGLGKAKDGFERGRRRRKGEEALVEMALVAVVVVLTRNIAITTAITSEYIKQSANFGSNCLVRKGKEGILLFDEVAECELREDLSNSGTLLRSGLPRKKIFFWGGGVRGEKGRIGRRTASFFSSFICLFLCLEFFFFSILYLLTTTVGSFFKNKILR